MQKRGIELNKKKWIIGLIASIILILLDQYTKLYLTKTISLHEQVDLIEHVLYFTYFQNTGAAFSLLTGFGNVFFGIITITALIFILYMFKDTENKFMMTGYILVFAGAIGNFIDRMFLNYVRDFIGVYIGSYAFPIFNVADICITVGFALILCWMLIEEIEEKKRWKKELLK